MSEPTSVKDELAALSKIVRVLDTVDRTAADRIVNWLYDRYEANTDAPESSDTPA